MVGIRASITRELISWSWLRLTTPSFQLAIVDVLMILVSRLTIGSLLLCRQELLFPAPSEWASLGSKDQIRSRFIKYATSSDWSSHKMESARTSSFLSQDGEHIESGCYREHLGGVGLPFG